MLELISDYIGTFLGTLISTIFGVLFVKYVLNKRICSNFVVSILLIIILPLVSTMLYMLNFSLIKTLISCFMFIILFKYIFKLTFYNSFLCSLIFMIMLTISEIFVFLFTTKLLNIGKDYLYNILSASILGNFIVVALSLILSYILRNMLRKVVNLKLKNYIAFYVFLLFSCIIFFFYITFSNIGNGISLLSGIIVICILIVIMLFLLYQVYKNNELTIKYDKLLDFIKKYEVEIDNQKTMRHEIKNQLLTIKSKLLDNDASGNIVNYINEIIEDNNKEINHTLYAKFNSLPSNGIKGLFYFKVSEAIDKKINVDVNISEDIKNSVLVSLNSTMFNQIGKLFGILLDNAIEASILANISSIGIEFYVIEDKVYCIISNTYNSKIMLNKNVLSRVTKNTGRGHGLLLAKIIVNNNERLSLHTSITDKLYIQKLIIK